jgi:hypothetical protein
MPLVKTSELTDSALDWAVAKCEGSTLTYHTIGTVKGDRVYASADADYCNEWAPSSDWSQGGPIIGREKIDLFYDPNGRDWCIARRWENFKEFKCDGPDGLIAAMRCYVASRFGDTIDIPTTVQD